MYDNIFMGLKHFKHGVLDLCFNKCESWLAIPCLWKGLNLNKEREHVILWRKLTRKLFNVYNDTTTIRAKIKYGLNKTDKNKATQGGRSSRIGQEPEGTSTNSPDENRETCYLVREGLIQATSARDMSVNAVILCDDPP